MNLEDKRMQEPDYAWYCNCGCEFFEIGYIDKKMYMICAECSHTTPLITVLAHRPKDTELPSPLSTEATFNTPRIVLKLDNQCIMYSIGDKLFFREGNYAD